jgi:hypothetical protein
MKNFKFFLLSLVMLVSVGAFSQQSNLFLKRNNNKLMNYGYTASATTTDSTLTSLATITIGSDEAGLVEVQLVGFNDSLAKAVTGSYIARYVKSGGTLTLGSPTAVSATVTDASLGTATWSITTSSNNIIVQVKGKAPAYTIRWFANIRRIYLKT